MRRALALLLFIGAGAPPLAAQEPVVQLAVELRSDTSGRTKHAVVHTDALLDDPRVAPMLASGFPVRLHYRLQIYRSRGSWFDAFVRQTEWDLVIRHEPLLDQYQVAEVFRNAQRAYRYAGREALMAGLAIPREVRVGPREPGEYYYVVSLEVSTLSDSDIKELEQFLSGEVAPAATGNEPLGSAFTNAIRRALLSVAGLPSVRKEARTGKFSVR
ncbi:MAG TPA: DUF4390 domain-containing protein [Gemmatimonadales bacterium]|nr:DUF4390 domain-containing protein [Gemmatimonadales bacterium]